MLKGCDISTFQSTSLDISEFDFVIVKATEGVNYQDDKFVAHAERVLAAGKLLGLYHYARPDLGNTGAAEAKSMLQYIKPYLGKCIIALDWENKSIGYPVSWIQEFFTTIKEDTGTTPFFYSFANELDKIQYSAIASKYPLWVAHWGTETPSTGVWSKWTIWQYTDTPFDYDYFNGTVQDWKDWAGGFVGEWITFNGWMTQAQMENNAELVWNYFRAQGWSLQAVCGMLGNMQVESNINPGIWGDLQEWGPTSGHGYGLVQWTPYTRITDWMQSHGYDIGDGNGQCAKIQEELEHPEIENTWHTSGTPYTMTFQEYSVSTQSPYDLALVFIACYERPADPNQPVRGDYALNWFRYLQGGPVFVPRLTSDGIEGNPYWYANNPFYQAGYGMPNCTCYVWGRWWEITGERPSKLSTGDGADFWPQSTANGVKGGQIPQLGAIACYYYTPGGHVAVVEQINEDGSIVTSNSGWQSTYFWTETVYPPDYKPSWCSQYSDFYFQGFLYLDTQPINPNPPNPNPEPGTFYEEMNMMFWLKPF